MRRDSGESYTEYLKRLAEAEGIEAQDAAALRRMDRCRPKKMSNAKWVNPHDREAEITRRKDGRTALAYKAEHAVDMETGAIVALTAHGGATGDTESVQQTLPAAGAAVGEQIATPTAEGEFVVKRRRGGRGGGRQGVSQWGSAGRDAGDGGADLHCGAGAGTAAIGGG